MTTPGLPVVVAANGRGLPVTVVTTGRGIPIQTSTNGYGIPVVVKASGGLPVQYVGVTNLLAGLSWIQGTNTSLSISGGFARATAIDVVTGLPRIYKSVTGLTNGATYRVQGQIEPRTAPSGVYLRVGLSPGIPVGELDQALYAASTPVDHTFVMSGTFCYLGIVPLCDTNGQYSEIADNFSLTLV